MSLKRVNRPIACQEFYADCGRKYEELLIIGGPLSKVYKDAILSTTFDAEDPETPSQNMQTRLHSSSLSLGDIA